MQNIKVSIIIPVYNVEPYIERCIKSVLRQTYRNLEVILVDDCSPDRSMDLAKEYINKNLNENSDLQFLFLKHDHNRGLSAARNTGIDAATGEYVYFLDSDDEITEDCISVLVKPIGNDKFDCVIGNIVAIGSDDPYFQLRGEGIYNSTKSIANAYLQEKWYPMAWNKLCRISFLKEHCLFFKEGLIHEDELWSFQLACTLQTLFAVKKHTYIYYIRPNSIITGNSIKTRTVNLLKVLRGMYEFQEANQLYFKEVDYIENNFMKSVFYWLRKDHNSLMSIYMKFRNADVRSLATKRRIYNTAKERILHFDLFFPALLGFCYKYLLWRVRILKEKECIPFC